MVCCYCTAICIRLDPPLRPGPCITLANVRSPFVLTGERRLSNVTDCTLLSTTNNGICEIENILQTRLSSNHIAANLQLRRQRVRKGGSLIDVGEANVDGATASPVYVAFADFDWLTSSRLRLDVSPRFYSSDSLRPTRFSPSRGRGAERYRPTQVLTQGACLKLK